VETYLKAIRTYGVSDTSLIHYNLALTYYRMGKTDEAGDSLVAGLEINPFHPSSNFLLGKICVEGGKKTQGFYSLCYFLLLEPNTERSKEVHGAIETLLTRSETIGISDTGSFTAADLLISLSSFLDEEDPGRSEMERFEAKLKHIFSALGELKDHGELERTPGDKLWWDFYVPLFRSVVDSGHIEAFSRYISMSDSEEANEWLKTNNDKVEAFFKWLNGG
jgi:tetratricopeptide (TPR) repeat protein